MDEHDIHTKEKLKFYLDEKIAIHLNLSKGRWANGSVIKIKEKTFIFEEEKLGKTLIFFEEVINLAPRKKKEEVVKG